MYGTSQHTQGGSSVFISNAPLLLQKSGTKYYIYLKRPPFSWGVLLNPRAFGLLGGGGSHSTLFIEGSHSTPATDKIERGSKKRC